MADQGLLGQSKPAAATNTVLYSAPIDQSASAVLTIANDGTASDYDIAIKDCDQELTVDASTYNLHRGDVITGYRFALDTPFLQSLGLTQGTTITSADSEKTAVFESFYTPAFTEITVKEVAIRLVTLESTSGTFVVGDTLTKGSGGDTTTATVFAVETTEGGNVIVNVGPSTINGSGSEFAAGDSVTATGGGAGTVSTGGVGSANDEFTFTESGGTESLFKGVALNVFTDRTYRFNVADSSMSGRDFKLSTITNGEWGPDGTTGTPDDGTEFTTGKTSNGTAGSSGAYVQYDFGADTSTPATLYFYDGGTGTAANANYGGDDRTISTTTSTTFESIYVYDLTGTWVNNTDSFTVGATSFTVTGQTASGRWGYVSDYTSTSLKVINGVGSTAFASSDTFLDVPKDNDATQTTVTVSSIASDTTAVAAENWIADSTLSANGVDKITSIVVGPGQVVVVESTTQNNVFSLIGFEDASNEITLRTFGA